jgi:uncharacterized protein YheU (UPF0270 family)
VQIPYEKLSPEALQGILEEFATRDGCDFSDLQPRLESLMTQLRRGQLQIRFDPDNGSIGLFDSGDGHDGTES